MNECVVTAHDWLVYQVIVVGSISIVMFIFGIAALMDRLRK